jgi:hypothetical protein
MKKRMSLVALIALAVGCAVMSTAGCKQTVATIVAEHGPRSLAMIAKVKALQPRVKATPRYSAAAVSPVKDLMVFRSAGGNALVIHERDLANPETFEYTPERPDFAGEAFTCARYARLKSEAEFSSALWTLEEHLQRCGAIKYVLVIRTHKRNMAKMIAGTSFLGGRIEGDVVAFTLAGHSLGGFAWHAASSDEVSVAQNATQQDMQWALDHHMRDKVEAAIRAELQRNFGNMAAW